MRSEWPLVLFTLLTQCAVGTFVAAGFARTLMTRALPEDLASALVRVPLAGVLSLVALAALSSTGHLVRPLQAWRAAGNPRASWLSVEILTLAGFAGLVVVVAVLEWRGGPGVVRDAAGALAASLGAGLLYAMGQLYRLPSRPAWNHPVTPVSFFITASLLGVLIVAASLAFSGDFVGGAHAFPDRLASLDRVLRILLFAGAALLVLEVLVIQAQATVRRNASRASALPESRRALAALRQATFTRTVLVMTALAVAGWFLLRRPALSIAEPVGSLLVWTVLWLAVAESVMGRIGFYRQRPVAGI